MSQKVSLVSIEGSTSVHVDLSMSESGNISVSGQEFGSAPEAFWGSDEYEYDLSIPPASWDALIIALGRKFYGDAPSGTDQFMAELDKAGIKNLFVYTEEWPFDEALDYETASLIGEFANDFWPRISEAEKARFLMSLIIKHYSGNASVVAELEDLLKASGSEFKTWSWC